MQLSNQVTDKISQMHLKRAEIKNSPQCEFRNFFPNETKIQICVKTKRKLELKKEKEM